MHIVIINNSCIITVCTSFQLKKELHVPLILYSVMHCPHKFKVKVDQRTSLLNKFPFHNGFTLQKTQENQQNKPKKLKQFLHSLTLFDACIHNQPCVGFFRLFTSFVFVQLNFAFQTYFFLNCILRAKP